MATKPVDNNFALYKPCLLLNKIVKTCLPCFDRVTQDKDNQQWLKIAALIVLLVVYRFFDFSLVFHCLSVCIKGGGWLICVLTNKDSLGGVERQQWWDDVENHLKLAMSELFLTSNIYCNALLVFAVKSSPKCLDLYEMWQLDKGMNIGALVDSFQKDQARGKAKTEEA